MAKGAQGFILTRHWRDTPKGVQIELWLSTNEGPVQLFITGQSPVFFIRLSDKKAVFSHLVKTQSLSNKPPLIKPLSLKNMHNEDLAGVYCQTQKQLRQYSKVLQEKNIPCWEIDVKPVERFLMERFVTASLEIPQAAPRPRKSYQTETVETVKPAVYKPKLKIVSLDIETSMDAEELFSIAVLSKRGTEKESKVFMVGGDDEKNENTEFEIIACESPKICLQRFLDWLHLYDPDIIIGWHVVQFDCWVLARLCEKWGVPFTLGRGQQQPYWREEDGSGQSVTSAVADTENPIFDGKRRYCQIAGRLILDGIELLRTAFYYFDSYSLQFVAKTLLGESKLIHNDNRGQEIAELFQKDKRALAAYNLHDCELVWDIFEKMDLINFAVARSQLTGLSMDKMGGSVATFEYAYLPRLHRKGYVAPNLGEVQSTVISPGGYVMHSRPGLYQNVLVLDFKSLYPSIMRTFLIDPYAFWFAQHQNLSQEEVVDGFNEAFFSRQENILPDIIHELWSERDKAKKNNDKALSQAIKIIMNSFYGVLGSTGCRFFDPRVCSSITLRGHEIIQESREFIEGKGYAVIYGDTDSLFVWVKDSTTDKSPEDVGALLANQLNEWWTEKITQDYQLKSALEIEFETHYHRFLMPTIRGSEQGSKKRYAGMIIEDDQSQLVFKGLEAVRADWTPLAKKFQQDLYRLVFEESPYQDYIKTLVADLLSGNYDQDLIYQKRLRRPVSGYQKSNPPHIKAAKFYESKSGKLLRKGDRVQYRITQNGPEPIEYQQSAIDYEHYIEKQLKPIADSVLYFLDDSFSKIIQKQMELI